jgi:hypothetical protein
MILDVASMNPKPQNETPARRARAEAEARRNAEQPTPLAKEFGGRDGPEPTRFGDWEKNGIASDF